MRRTRAVAAPELDAVNAMQAAVRAHGEPTPDELELINRAHAAKPLGPQDVYVFRMEISNDLPDSYWTRMDPETTLRNYVDDFRDGRAIQSNHKTTELPLGRSFDADLEQRGQEGNRADPKRTAAVLKAYIPRGVNLNGIPNDDLIRGIESGVIKDGSVHFDNDARYVCDVCGGDMFERGSRCIHLPGMRTEDGGRVSARIVNGHAIEASLVFDGSTPRAMIDKAQRMAAAGQLSGRDVAVLEKLYRARIITSSSTTPEIAGTPGPPLGDQLVEPLNDGGSETAQCPSCGTWLPADAERCPNCGAAMGPARGRATTGGEGEDVGVVEQMAGEPDLDDQPGTPPGNDDGDEDNRSQEEPDAMTERAAAHPPFTGTHSHPHPAFGAQGGDATHEHQHAHDGDSVHDHPGDHSDRSFVDLVEPHVRETVEFLGVDAFTRRAVEAWPAWATATSVQRAVWSTSFVNDLPDSAFAVIEDGGTKDADGRTTPRSLRHFPHHGDGGAPDAAHVRNALGRIPQSKLSDPLKAKALAHVEGHAKSMGIGDQKSRREPARGGVLMLDPELFANLCGSRLTRGQTDTMIDALVAGDPEGVTPAFVRTVAAQIVQRAGPQMNDTMASQMQGILDKMADAHDAHTEALDDLKTLVGMGSEAGMQYGLPDQTAGLQAMDPPEFGGTSTENYGPGATPNGTGNGTAPTNGVIGRSRVVAMGGQSLSDKVKSGLGQIQSIMSDLLADDANENAQDVENQGAVGMGITEDAIGPGPATGADQEPYGRGRGEDPEKRAVRILETRKALRAPEFEPLRRLLQQAGDGRRYRSLTMRELIEWGTRAQGNAFPRELYIRLIPSMETADAEELTRQFKDQAYARFANTDVGELPEWFGQGEHPLAARVGRASAPATERHSPPETAKTRRPTTEPAVDISRYRSELS